jgi:hypothetical protein
MKKILLAAALSSNLLFAEIDFTSFENKTFTPLNSNDSPGALSNLHTEHKWVHETHEKEINEEKKIRLLIKELYVENNNLIFEMNRLNEMIFNYVKIKYERVDLLNE